MGKLTARQVATSKPGRIGDGDGLWLETSPTSKRRWLIRYSRPGGAGVTETAIGSATYMSLAEAREAAFEFKRNLAKGILPVRKATFAAVAVDVLEAKSARFKRSLRGSREVCAVQEKSARFKRSLRGSREVCAVQERKPDRPSLGQVAHLLQAPRRVNRRRTLTPDRRPKLTRFVTAANGSARPGEAGQGCAAGARADR